MARGKGKRSGIRGTSGLGGRGFEPALKRQRPNDAKRIPELPVDPVSPVGVAQPPIEFAIWPKQAMALRSKADELFFGGAAGGGKSHYLRLGAIRLVHGRARPAGVHLPSVIHRPEIESHGRTTVVQRHARAPDRARHVRHRRRRDPVLERIEDTRFHPSLHQITHRKIYTRISVSKLRHGTIYAAFLDSNAFVFFGWFSERARRAEHCRIHPITTIRFPKSLGLGTYTGKPQNASIQIRGGGRRYCDKSTSGSLSKLNTIK
jgi:hypothetical protein